MEISRLWRACARYARSYAILQIIMQRVDAIQIAGTNRSMGNLELHVLYIYIYIYTYRSFAPPPRYWRNWKGRRDCDYVNFFAYDNSTGRPCARKFSFHNRRNYILTRLAGSREIYIFRSAICLNVWAGYPINQKREYIKENLQTRSVLKKIGNFIITMLRILTRFCIKLKLISLFEWWLVLRQLH